MCSSVDKIIIDVDVDIIIVDVDEAICSEVKTLRVCILYCSSV